MGIVYTYTKADRKTFPSTVGAPCHHAPMLVRDHMTLTIAATHYAHPGARERHAYDHLGMTSPRFWRRVLWLIEQPDVEQERPLEVRRLRRLRDARGRVR